MRPLEKMALNTLQMPLRFIATDSGWNTLKISTVLGRRHFGKQ